MGCGLALVGLLLASNAHAAPDIPTQSVTTSDFQAVREALVEMIEADGLVVSAVIPFGDMLARTASALDKPETPYSRVEIIQFCSALLAWRLVEEDASQAALCPLSIAIFSTRTEPGQVVLAYRSPGRNSPGRIQADELLRKIVSRAIELAGYQRKP